MRTRLPYCSVITAMALNVTRLTFQRRGVILYRKRGVQCIARTLRGEALPILANQIGRFS